VFIILFLIGLINYISTRQAPYRGGSELSLKRVKREQTEEEAGSHRGLSATEPPKEGSGSYFFALAVRAIFAPVVLLKSWAWAWAWAFDFF
jgi:hypothetical protein